MTFTSERLDQHLAEWRSKLDRVSQNLIELHGLSQRLSDPNLPPLTGQTQIEVAPALEAMNSLFQQFDALSDVINRAIALRQQLPRWLPSEQQIQEIERLLTGESIQLPGNQIPLMQRSLLSAQEIQTAIAPIQLLNAMTQTFEQAKTIVLKVDTAWNAGYQTTIALNTELTHLRSLASACGINHEVEFTEIESAIASLQFGSNPLGAMDQFEQIQLQLEQSRTTITQSKRQKLELSDRLKSARKLLHAIVEQQRSAIATYQEAQEKTTEKPLQSPISEDTIEALAQWLKRLETKFLEGAVSAIAVGLENWMTKAKEAWTEQNQSVSSNQSLIDLRQELRGRLDALQAKAVARGVAEDQMLSTLSKQAKQALYLRPTPMNQAIELLTDYEKRLNKRNEST